MKKLLPLLLTLILPSLTFGQCYDVSQRPYYPDPFTGGFIVGNMSDDVHSTIIDLGFDFCFFGDSVSQVVISSNGYLTFDLANAQQGSSWSINSPIPNGANTGNLFSIMAPWQDINPGVDGEIRYATYGVPPYRRFVVSYDSIAMFSCTDLAFSNQVVLYESLNVIDINIADKPLCENWNAGAAIEGIQNQDGTVAYVVPGRNFPEQWTAQYDSYRFTPLCDCPTDSLPDMSLVPGKVFWDLDGDCELDQNEPLVPHVRIDIQPNDGIVWTNQNGEFALMMEPGNYTMEHSSLNPWYMINTCNTGQIPVTVLADSNALDVCFGDSLVPFVDLEVSIAAPWLSACFGSQQFVEVCNNGTVTAYDAELTVTLPAILVDVVSELVNISDSTWSITLDSLAAGDCVQFTFTDSVICDSVVVGLSGCFSASVTILNNEGDSTNNTMSGCGIIGASYDPNDKRVQAQNPEEGWLTEEQITANDELTYMIRFQNTGTGPAYNVIIQDELSQYLNHQSIDPIMASHDYYMQMTDGRLSIHFLGIELPDSASDPMGSMGFIMFRVRQNAGNQLGTFIENEASIFFDFNAPVITNTTVNEIPMLVSTFDTETNTISIYPNPAYDKIHFNTKDANGELKVEIFDVTGKSVLVKNYSTARISVDLQHLNPGIYLVKVSDGKDVLVERIIKQ